MAYVPQEEVAAMKDCVVEYRNKLITEEVLTEEEADEIVSQQKSEVDAAIQFGLDSPYPDPDDAFQNIYAGVSP